jgi:hypothetical protein
MVKPEPSALILTFAQVELAMIAFASLYSSFKLKCRKFVSHSRSDGFQIAA